MAAVLFLEMAEASHYVARVQPGVLILILGESRHTAREIQVPTIFRLLSWLVSDLNRCMGDSHISRFHNLKIKSFNIKIIPFFSKNNYFQKPTNNMRSVKQANFCTWILTNNQVTTDQILAEWSSCWANSDNYCICAYLLKSKGKSHVLWVPSWG